MSATLGNAKGVTLREFLASELKASTLNIKVHSSTELVIESDSIVQIHVMLNENKKKLSFDLYSPRWARRIMVQQLGGFEFMESQAEEELEKENADKVAEDSLLALDMIRYWASKNDYAASEVAPSSQEQEAEKSHSPPTPRATRSKSD